MIFYVPFEQKKIEEEEQQQFLGFTVQCSRILQSY